MKIEILISLAVVLLIPSVVARKKVAVLLSGGGVKGTAHIGTLFECSRQ